MSNSSKAFKDLPELDFDPDHNQKAPTEEQERAKEANQSFTFREKAFTCSLYVCGLVFGVWLILIFNWPDIGKPTAAYYLYGLKLSLSTIALITIAIAILRFAIQCYGHHQSSSSTIETPNGATIVSLGKTVEQVGKTLQSSGTS